MTIKWHPSLTFDRIIAACMRRMNTPDSPGFCLACGHEQDGCEPDARNYVCESCGQHQVFGSDELVIIANFAPSVPSPIEIEDET